MDASVRDGLLSALAQSFPQKQIMEHVPMSRYTTLRLGGPADVLAEVTDARQLAAAIIAARTFHVPVTLLGNGSNLLVRDGGVRGLVIHLGDGFAEISEPAPLPDGRFALTAQAGATLQKLANRAADYALTGLEFAGGIPGTVGGAVYMNAGAYGGEMKDVVSGITAVNREGETLSFSAEDLQLSYRYSCLSDWPAPCAAASVTVVLQPGDQDTIRAAMRELNARRREKQPLALPSCGSTFKRPQGQFAAALIEQCGLKGARIGGASVSTLHAGFLVNDGQGTAADYLALIAHVQKTVLDQTGVQLEPEVRIIGEESPAQVI